MSSITISERQARSSASNANRDGSAEASDAVKSDVKGLPRSSIKAITTP